jgi:hypothetical protein
MCGFKEIFTTNTIRRGIFCAFSPSIATLFCASESHAFRRQYDGIIVFGASVSDTGNSFIILSDPCSFEFDDACDLGTPAYVRPYDQLDEFLIPSGAYAKGGRHVTNGANLGRGAGARQSMLTNVPNFGQSPAVQLQMGLLVSYSDIDVRILYLYKLFSSMRSSKIRRILDSRSPTPYA